MVISPSVIGVASGSGFLGVAAYWNWRHATVSNALLALFVIAFVPAAWASGWPVGEIAQRCTAFAVALVPILFLFAIRVLSGGAGKLIAVTLLWLPSSMALPFGIACAVLAGTVYLASRLGTPRWLLKAGERFAATVAILGILFLVASV
ncbi:MAG TPA: prepilin peptidase [Methylomirabilota bacterium]|nr:prepilin peptidase [Methylomirabilota bacterium]